jgi:hypothetical protein
MVAHATPLSIHPVVVSHSHKRQLIIIITVISVTSILSAFYFYTSSPVTSHTQVIISRHDFRHSITGIQINAFESSICFRFLNNITRRRRRWVQHIYSTTCSIIVILIISIRI